MTGPNKRIDIRNQNITVSGDGTGGDTSNVAIQDWGPEFGGPDPHHPVVDTAVAFTEMEFTAFANMEGTTTFPSTSVTGFPSASGTVTTSIETTSFPSSDVDVSRTNVEYSSLLSETSSVSRTNTEFTATPSSSNTVAFTDMDVLSSASGSVDITRTEIRTFNIFPEGDVYVPEATTLGDCNDTTNHDGEDLIIGSGVGSDDENIWVKWDLSGLPSNATIQSAEFIYNNEPSPNSGSARIIDLLDTASDSDSWEEETITCPDAPAHSASNKTFTEGTAGDNTVQLDTSDILTRIGSRIGTGDFTLVISDNSDLGASATWNSKDEGTGDSKAPRLNITFTI